MAEGENTKYIWQSFELGTADGAVGINVTAIEGDEWEFVQMVAVSHGSHSSIIGLFRRPMADATDLEASRG